MIRWTWVLVTIVLAMLLVASPVLAQESSASASATAEGDEPFCDELTQPEQGWGGSLDPSVPPGGQSSNTPTASASASASATSTSTASASPEPPGPGINTASAHDDAYEDPGCQERPTTASASPDASASPLGAGAPNAAESSFSDLPSTGGIHIWPAIAATLALAFGAIVCYFLLRRTS